MTEAALFRFVGNRAAIDFANTRIMRDGAECDMLATKNDLERWLKKAGIQHCDSVTDDTFKAAKALRDALKSLFNALIDNDTINQAELDVINQFLKTPDNQLMLKTSGKDICLKPQRKPNAIKSILYNIAKEGAEILVSSNHKRLRNCADAHCILTFIDTSKSGRRKWCSMETCGNRAKASRHYHSQNAN